MKPTETHNDITMPSLTIKNIPTELYQELKQVAEQHHRSINSEVISCLKQVLLPKKISSVDKLARIQALRAQIEPNRVTVDDIERAIDDGRA